MTTEITRVPSQSSLKPTTPRRRFQLLDMMILVAATTLACGITVWIDRVSDQEISVTFVPAPSVVSSQPPSIVVADSQQIIRFVLEASFELIGLTLPFFAMWTLALIPIRLRLPRPRLRRLAPARYESHMRRWRRLLILAGAVRCSRFREFTADWVPRMGQCVVPCVLGRADVPGPGGPDGVAGLVPLRAMACGAELGRPAGPRHGRLLDRGRSRSSGLVSRFSDDVIAPERR